MFSVAADASGNCFIAGYFNSPSITIGATTFINAGNNDLLIVKYDQDGNVLWAKSAGGPHDDYAWSVAGDASGNIYVVGIFYSTTITFGSTILTNTYAGFRDMYIVKYDANGNVLWAKKEDGIWDDNAYSVSVDASGNSYVAGIFYSPTLSFGLGLITLTNTGNLGTFADLFLAKYDPDGNVLWAKSMGSTSDDLVYSISTDASGNSYLAGRFFSPTITFGATTLTNSGDYNMYLVKYDANGDVLWAKSTSGNTNAKSVTIDPAGSGGCYLTGYFLDTVVTFDSFTLTNTATDTSPDIFLVKYDDAGNVLWVKSAAGIIIRKNHKALLLMLSAIFMWQESFYSTPFILDSTTLSCAGYYDMFIAKIGDTTAASPVSAFLSSDTVLCEKFCIGFTDQSLNNPVSWNWIFEGGSPSTSSDQNPTNICYDDPGTFDVTLITTNANGISDTLSLNNYITVNPNPFAPTITQSGNALTSSFAITYQWYLNGNLIPGATDQNYTISQAGLYTVEVTNENGCKSQSSIKAYLVGIESLNSDDGIFIYPNPSDGNFVMEWQHTMMTGNLEIEVLNVIGQQVFSSEEQITSPSFKKEMDLGQLADGIYFIEAKTDDLILKKKIMILH